MSDTEVLAQIGTGDAPVWSELPLPPDETIGEHAYLVARGVRPLALVQTFVAEPVCMARVATRLQSLSVPGAIPFVIDKGNGHAECGYAAAGWAVDLYRWAVAGDTVPDTHRHRIIGLLLGYNSAAIAAYEENKVGMLFRWDREEPPHPTSGSACSPA